MQNDKWDTYIYIYILNMHTCVCIHVHIYAYIYIYIYMQICIHVHTRIYNIYSSPHIYICITPYTWHIFLVGLVQAVQNDKWDTYIYIYTIYAYVCMYTCTHIYIYRYICVYTHIYANMYICVYAYVICIPHRIFIFA